MHLTPRKTLTKTLRQQLNLKRVDVFYNVFNIKCTLLLTLRYKIFIFVLGPVKMLTGQVKMETTDPTKPAEKNKTKKNSLLLRPATRS